MAAVFIDDTISTEQENRMYNSFGPRHPRVSADLTELQSVPFARPAIDQEEIDSVVAVLRSGWLTSGPKTEEFERAFKDFIGIEHAIAVNSATAGLHLALEAAGVQRGHKVITSAYTFTASAEVARYLDAEIELIDIDERTLNLNPDHLEAALVRSSGVRAIIPVHVAGQACRMDEICRLAEKHRVRLIDDAAHALPTTYKGRLIGTFGDSTVFSFYATKPITTGEGGMIVTHDAEFAARMRVMRLHGIDRDASQRSQSAEASWYYEVIAPGFKYNITDLASAIGVEQLKKAHNLQRRRAEIARAYSAAFVDLPLQIPFVEIPTDTHAWHLYVIQLALERIKITRDHFIHILRQCGIGTSVHFIPLHLHPYWRDRYGWVPESFRAANAVYQRAVSLPIYSSMSESDVTRVIDVTRSVLLKNLR
jgi:dTDP-4-amino-4,6-dideoxygalactose transaminase